MLLIPLIALARTEPGIPVDEKPTASAEAAELEVERAYDMEFGFRSRWMTVPDSILDIGFYNGEDQSGLHPDRPGVRALALGVEYVLRQGPAAGIFYAEYLRSLMGEGYWDDVEDPPNFSDGTYLRPDRLGMVALGADYAFGLPFNPGAPNCEVSFTFGGGLGIGFLTGDILTWESTIDPSSGQFSSAYDILQSEPDREPDGTLRIPRVLPLVDINTGLRLLIAQKASIRIEGGLHDMLYLGGSAGIMF